MRPSAADETEHWGEAHAFDQSFKSIYETSSRTLVLYPVSKLFCYGYQTSSPPEF